MPRQVLIVDDDEYVRDMLKDVLVSGAYEVLEAENIKTAAKIFSAEACDAAVVDYELPDGTALDLIPKFKAVDATVPIVILTGHGTIQLAVEAIKMGAEQFLTKPTDPDVILHLLNRLMQDRRSQSREVAQTTKGRRFQADPFLGTSGAIRRLREEVENIVGTNRPILIEGETGTGKGVLAQWLHKRGPRSREAMVDLSCADFSRELLDSELFGHEKGSFTGAEEQKRGLLEVANRGTVFLDEIGDLDVAIQPKLLKALEEKRFRRVGSVVARSVDVHLITATNRDLRALVAEGKFRNDLYFRISCLPLHLPPLRERPEDISLLAEFLLNQLKAELGHIKAILSEDAIAALKSYSWPGNVRELRNVLERAAIISKNSSISPQDLILQGETPVNRADSRVSAAAQSLAEVERQHILKILELENASAERTAVRLGIPRSTLYVKMRRYGITTERKYGVSSSM